MKIYTRKGDQGQTSLIGGTRVPKYHLRIEAYGTVDELNSYLGLLRDEQIDQKLIHEIVNIQDRLFTMGSILAADPEKSKMQLPPLSQEDIDRLERGIDEMNEELPEMRNFVLPGGHPLVGHCHVARCICRRTERLVLQLNEENPVDPLVLPFLNRLSDYLFVLSRKLTKDFKVEEIPWKPKM